MTTRKKESPDYRPYTCFTHRGITYVPHYDNVSVYVGPGYPRFTEKTYTANQLLEAGAEPVELLLSPRPEYTQKVIA